MNSIGMVDQVSVIGTVLSTKVYSKLCPELLFVRVIHLHGKVDVHYFDDMDQDSTVKSASFETNDEALEFAKEKVKNLVSIYQSQY